MIKKYTLKDYLELCEKRRGEYLSSVVDLERIIDSIISSYFCDDDYKNKILNRTLLLRVNFMTKIKVLSDLSVNKETKKYHKLRTLIVTVNKIRDMRNKFAHNSIDTDKWDYRIKKGISFYKDFYSKEHVNVDENKFKAMLSELWDCKMELLTFNNTNAPATKSNTASSQSNL